MTDKTPEEQRIDHLRMMAGSDMDHADINDINKLTSEKPAVEEPVGRDFMWLHPIELIKGLFSSRKD